MGFSRRFADRVAIVTGGSNGIGAAIVDRLVAEGAIVIAVGRGDYPKEPLPDESHYRRCDVTSSADWAALIDYCREGLGRIDVLFNNAALTVPGEVHAMNEEDWDRSFEVVAKGTFLGCKAALPMMIEQRRGAIVNIGSVAGVLAMHSYPAYASAKASVHHFTKQVAMDYGKYGIRCNALCPGPTLTPKTRLSYFEGETTTETGKWLIQNLPLGRFAEASELAAAAVFLGSDDASFVTGAVLMADGGQTIHVGAMREGHAIA